MTRMVPQPALPAWGFGSFEPRASRVLEDQITIVLETTSHERTGATGAC